MSKPRFRFIYLLFLLISFNSKAQVNLDSLWGVWNDKTQPDTSRLKAMKSIAWDGYLFSQPDSAFYFAQMGYDLAEARNNKKWMAILLNTQGVSFYIRGDYESSFDYYNNSLKISEKNKDKQCIASSLSNIGIIYDIQGDFAKAIDYYTRSLKIREEFGDNNGIADCLNNIGVIYRQQGETTKAIDYFKRSLKIKEQIGNQNDIALLLMNIGNIYKMQGNAQKAMDYYTRSLKLKEKIGDKKGIALCLLNIGNICDDQGETTKAIDYYIRSLKNHEEIGDIKGTAISLYNIGGIYKQQGEYLKSLDFNTEALIIAQKIGNIETIKFASQGLWFTYKKIGKYKQALEMHELYMETKDSLAKMDAEEELYKFEVDKEYQLKKQADSIMHADEIIIQQAENRAKEEQLKSEKQRRTGLLVIVGLVLVSLGFVFIQLRKTRAQKVVIEGQHEKLNESHREITDSINYAKRIQDALMTSAVYIKEVLPESFILFNPKDVVSGDFYWVYRSPKGQIYFTVADCTGHGVPGAFMSMIGTSLLNEFIIENNIEDTAEVLTKMREQIIKSLDQKGLQGENKDGMDMALCKYDPKKGTVQYSGAYNPLLHISKNEINQLKGDSQPVGLHTGKKLPFTSKEIQVAKGDMLYIYSDGFPDQFGGEKGKKYLSGKFKKFLLSISDKPIDEQNTLIKDEFANWIGDHEQIDDVCVMGVRITC